MADYTQRPFAIVLGCSDSRTPVEILFDEGFGDLFVVRIAGNVENADGVASLEYGAKVLGIPLIMVMGHTACGAVDAAVGVADGGAMPGGAVDDIVNHILPAVRAAKNEVTPDQNLLTEAIKANAIQSRDIVLKDPLIAAEVSKGKLEVVAAYYDIDTGKFVVL